MEGRQNGTAAPGLGPLRRADSRLAMPMKLRSVLGTVAVSAVLFGCGGGGGGGMPQVQPQTPLPPSPPPPPQPTADSFRTPEYNRLGALDAVHAADAYALGYTGAGVIVGVVDFNFDLGSSEVNYHPA